jgi:hypothetical protein
MKVTKNSPKNVTDEYGNVFELSSYKKAYYNPITPQMVSYYKTIWYYKPLKDYMKYRDFEIKIIKRFNNDWDCIIGKTKHIIAYNRTTTKFQEFKNVTTLEEAKSLIDKMQDYFRALFPKGSKKTLEDTPFGKHLKGRNKPLFFRGDDMFDDVDSYMHNPRHYPKDLIEVVIPALMNVVNDESLIDWMCAEWRLELKEFMKSIKI